MKELSILHLNHKLFLKIFNFHFLSFSFTSIQPPRERTFVVDQNAPLPSPLTWLPPTPPFTPFGSNYRDQSADVPGVYLSDAAGTSLSFRQKLQFVPRCRGKGCRDVSVPVRPPFLFALAASEKATARRPGEFSYPPGKPVERTYLKLAGLEALNPRASFHCWNILPFLLDKFHLSTMDW